MADANLNIWANTPDAVAEPSALFSPILPLQSPKAQRHWSTCADVKDTQENSLTQARVLAIFRSGKFPNKVDTSSVVIEDLEQGCALELGYPFDAVDDYGDYESAVFPEFEEDLFDPEEDSLYSLSYSSSSSTGSTSAEEFILRWYPYLRAVFCSRSKEECINACRILILSNSWDHASLHELACQLVYSALAGVPAVAVATCATHIRGMLLDASKHEEASYFASCISAGAFTAWHHYWNPATSFSIYPGKSFLVTEQHLQTAYISCRLLGALFQANIVTRAPVKEVVELTLQNALLLEHIDAVGHLLSYASTEFWTEASTSEKDAFVQELYDVLEQLCQFHQLSSELTDEYGLKLEEICGMMKDRAV